MRPTAVCIEVDYDHALRIVEEMSSDLTGFEDGGAIHELLGGIQRAVEVSVMNGPVHVSTRREH